MIQNLITYLLIIAAFSYAFYKLYLTIFPKKIKAASTSHSCSGCSGCELKNTVKSVTCTTYSPEN